MRITIIYNTLSTFFLIQNVFFQQFHDCSCLLLMIYMVCMILYEPKKSLEVKKFVCLWGTGSSCSSRWHCVNYVYYITTAGKHRYCAHTQTHHTCATHLLCECVFLESLWPSITHLLWFIAWTHDEIQGDSRSPHLHLDWIHWKQMLKETNNDVIPDECWLKVFENDAFLVWVSVWLWTCCTDKSVCVFVWW